MAKVGDKFIIEIGEIYIAESGEEIYRIKGFNALMFDEHGINKLKQGERDETYQKGYIKGYDKGYDKGKEISEIVFKEAVKQIYDELPQEPVKMPKEDEPTMPEIGAMERLTKDFFDFCNGITGKGSE